MNIAISTTFLHKVNIKGVIYGHVKALTLACVVLMSAVATADTDVYFTNNSAKQMNISISHSGSDQLIKGLEWFQHADVIGPWETKMLLSVNRWEGVKSGHDYHFTTSLTDSQGDVVELHQEIQGHWYNSTLKHGLSYDGQALEWHQDRDIHRYQQVTRVDDASGSSVMTTEFALKSSSTARYDDLYYALTPQPALATDPIANNSLTVMTYNIWALPVIASHINERLALLPQKMRGHDVLMLQEVFAPGRGAFLRALAQEYPYQTRMLDKSGVNIYDGGVMIVSRYPIVAQAQFVYPDCSGTDCFADKGINYAQVIKQGEAYHVFATHTASFDTDVARSNRQKQFKQMREFAHSLAIPADETVIYGGDFNVNKRKFEDDYQQMFANLKAKQPSYSGYTESTFDPRINEFAGTPLSGGENVEYLDYIVISDEYAQTQSNDNDVKVPRSSAASLWQKWNLSDHFPVVSIVAPLTQPGR